MAENGRKTNRIKLYYDESEQKYYITRTNLLTRVGQNVKKFRNQKIKSMIAFTDVLFFDES